MKKTKQYNGDIVYGINPIKELLKAKQRKVLSLYTTKPMPKAWHSIQSLLPSYPIDIKYVAKDVLTRIAGTSDHQSVIAVAQPFPYRKKPFSPEKDSFLVLLDNIQDPRNLGAIIRSAYCTGAHGIIICEKKSAPLNPTALKSSAGLAEHMPIYLAPSSQQAAQELKNAGYHLYLANFGGKDARTCTFEKPTCVVIGSEGFGISKELYTYGTEVTLPQRSNDISYNASVAAGLLLFLVSSQHKHI